MTTLQTLDAYYLWDLAGRMYRIETSEEPRSFAEKCEQLRLKSRREFYDQESGLTFNRAIGLSYGGRPEGY